MHNIKCFTAPFLFILYTSYHTLSLSLWLKFCFYTFKPCLSYMILRFQFRIYKSKMLTFYWEANIPLDLFIFLFEFKNSCFWFNLLTTNKIYMVYHAQNMIDYVFFCFYILISCFTCVITL